MADPHPRSLITIERSCAPGKITDPHGIAFGLTAKFRRRQYNATAKLIFPITVRFHQLVIPEKIAKNVVLVSLMITLPNGNVPSEIPEIIPAGSTVTIALHWTDRRFKRARLAPLGLVCWVYRPETLH